MREFVKVCHYGNPSQRGSPIPYSHKVEYGTNSVLHREQCMRKQATSIFSKPISWVQALSIESPGGPPTWVEFRLLLCSGCPQSLHYVLQHTKLNNLNHGQVIRSCQVQPKTSVAAGACKRVLWSSSMLYLTLYRIFFHWKIFLTCPTELWWYHAYL
jgi:hypothetical protein